MLFPGVALTLCIFVVYSTLHYVLPCVLSLCFSVLLALRLPRLGKKSGLCVFRAFVCFALAGLSLFPLPLSVKDWLRLMLMALPGLFVLPFFPKYGFKMVSSNLCHDNEHSSIYTNLYHETDTTAPSFFSSVD